MLMQCWVKANRGIVRLLLRFTKCRNYPYWCGCWLHRYQRRLRARLLPPRGYHLTEGIIDAFEKYKALLG